MLIVDLAAPGSADALLVHSIALTSRWFAYAYVPIICLSHSNFDYRCLYSTWIVFSILAGIWIREVNVVVQRFYVVPMNSNIRYPQRKRCDRMALLIWL
jgi:hypothetical protein